MAQYRVPPDPRESGSDQARPRLRRPPEDERQPIPWLWLGLGVLVTLLGIGLAIGLATLFLTREPLTVTLPTPTIIRLTAPPSPVPSPTPLLPTLTSFPTFTPPPTPDLSVAPASLRVGFFASVANTENIGVSLRGGPSTDNVRLELVSEGTIVLVIGGPEDGNSFTWWQVRLDDGTEGWVAGDFLLPAAAPEREADS